VNNRSLYDHDIQLLLVRFLSVCQLCSQNPPAIVKFVMEAVCVMLNIKAERKPDGSGNMVEDYWGPSVKLLGDMKFLDKLKSYDKDSINPEAMKKIRAK